MCAQGVGLSDCCTVLLCLPCAVAQHTLEIEHGFAGASSDGRLPEEPPAHGQDDAGPVPGAGYVEHVDQELGTQLTGGATRSTG